MEEYQKPTCNLAVTRLVPVVDSRNPRTLQPVTYEILEGQQCSSEYHHDLSAVVYSGVYTYLNVAVEISVLSCIMRVAVEISILSCIMRVAVEISILSCIMRVAVEISILSCIMRVAVEISISSMTRVRA